MRPRRLPRRHGVQLPGDAVGVVETDVAGARGGVPLDAMVRPPSRVELLPQPLQLSGVRDRQREVIEPDAERVEPIGSTRLLARAEEGDSQAVRVDDHCRWRLPHEPEPERVDVEALGLGQIADPEPHVTERVGPKPHGGPSFLYLAFNRYVSLGGT